MLIIRSRQRGSGGRVGWAGQRARVLCEDYDHDLTEGPHDKSSGGRTLGR